jgi:tetratricopeptide (TPR) repeat protein
MNKFHLAIGVFLFQVSMLVASDRPQCLLYERDRLTNLNWQASQRGVLPSAVVSLDQFVLNRLNGEGRLSYRERRYLEGYISWNAGKIQDAQNAWIKFLALSHRHTGDAPDPRVNEVKTYFNQALKRSFKNKATLKDDDDGSKGVPDRDVARKKIIGSGTNPKQPIEKISPVISADQLVVEAKAAETHGQYEYALRLFQMAERLDPKGEEIKKAIAALRKEMGD